MRLHPSVDPRPDPTCGNGTADPFTTVGPVGDHRNMSNVGDYLQWQRRRGLADSTIELRRVRLFAYVRWLDEHGVAAPDATEAHVEAFLAARPRGLHDVGRAGWLSCLGLFHRWLVRTGRADHDPTADIPRPRVPRGLPRPLEWDDVAMLLRATTGRPALHAWITLAAYAGLRCAEIAWLPARPVLDTGNGPHLLVLGKGRKERLVPAHPLVLAALNRVQTPRQGPLFPVDDTGADVTPYLVSRRICRLMRHLGIDGTAHALRHTFATACYVASDGDIRTVQELLGHSSPTTTAIYTAWSRPKAVEAVLKL